MYIHRKFSPESVGEKILKIGPHLPKLLSNIKGYTFLGHSVYIFSNHRAIMQWPWQSLCSASAIVIFL